MCLSTKCGYRDLAARGTILKLAEVHGEVRDMLRAEGLQERMEGVEQRVGSGSTGRESNSQPRRREYASSAMDQTTSVIVCAVKRRQEGR